MLCVEEPIGRRLDFQIQEYNYQATTEAIERAVAAQPKAKDVVAAKDSAEHPFAAK